MRENKPTVISFPVMRFRDAESVNIRTSSLSPNFFPQTARL